MNLRVLTLSKADAASLRAHGWTFGGMSGSEQYFFWTKWPEWPPDPRIDLPEIEADGCKSRHVMQPIDAE